MIRKDSFYHHYIKETFYSSLFRTQKRLNEIYNTWYSISKANISNGHPLSKAITSIDEKGFRRFYCNKNLSKFDVEEFIAPTEDIKLFIRNYNYPKNYFFERAREFNEIFPGEEKLIEYKKQKKLVESLEEENAKNSQLLEETNKKITEENLCSRRLIYFTIMLGW